jgi:alpha-tubulin suppressor-like RCC1 family protein
VCALTSDGEVKCWGSNHDGELGDGTTEDRTRPVAVSGLGGKAVAVAVGAFHTCALMASGGVKCWGSNDDGQLGDGTTEDSANPVDVVGLKTGVVAIAAAFGSSCAVMITGGVKCWGDNYWGQLGDGTTEDSAMPVDVVGLKAGVTAISGSADTMCAISRSGGVWCWGNNEFGTLGNGTTISSSTPVDVTGLGSGVTAIAVGSHACAVIKGGGVRCWGYNHYGELGDGTWTDSSVPVDVVGLDTRATAIGAHYYNSCALLSDGKVMCWGDDSQGQLGRGAVSGSAPSDTSAFPPSTGTHQVDADSD